MRGDRREHRGPVAGVRFMTDAQCPVCRHPLITDEPGQPAWCERCQWGLNAFVPDKDRPLGWVGRRIAKLDHDTGYRLSIRLHKSLQGKRIDRPGVSPAALWLAAISGAFLAAMLLIIALGVWLIAGHPWPAKVLGCIVIGLSLVLRPRFGRLKPWLREYDEVKREEAPELFALIDRVAAEAGTPRPHHVLLGAEWNAFAGTRGLRRRRVLMLGLPLFHTIRPQEKVALLGHEMGHFANGDPKALAVTGPALINFGILAELLYPDRVHDGGGGFGFIVFLAERAIWPLLYLASRLCLLAHIGTNIIGARQSQRAEYYADAQAVRVAGTQGALGLMDVFAMDKGLVTVVGARSRARSSWREGVELSRAATEPRMPRLRQLTLRREASVLSSHPPTGLRGALIAGLAAEGGQHEPRVVLTEEQVERIDAELEKLRERYHRTIAQSW